MGFKETFRKSAKSNRMINLELDSEILIPNKYAYNSQALPAHLSKHHYFHLLAGGNIRTDLPFSFSFSPIDTYLLLYTEQGGGRLTCQGNSIAMTESSLLIFNCNTPFSLNSLVLPWNFKLFFFQGRDLELFAPFLKAPSLFTIPEHSPILRDISHLLSIPVHTDISSLLKMHQAFTNIFYTLSLSSMDTSVQANSDIPYYLAEMKDYLDHHYEESFSLEHYEERLNVSKYRLCREFSNTFGDAPLRYLNKIRLEAAKEMLLTTDLNIHEVSSKVGYENVNHFINLFKKSTGSTPRVFRQKALQAPPVLRSPVQ